MWEQAMRAFVQGALRVATATFVVVTGIAIAIGRQQGSIPDDRQTAVPLEQPISGYLFRSRSVDFSMLSVETGVLSPVRIPGGDTIELAACSPWRDGRGRTHVAGMWIRNAGPAGPAAMGLARFAYPGWEAVDLVETEQVPASSICWFPDTS